MQRPTTYGEWASVLEDAAQRANERDVTCLLATGTLDGGAASVGRLVERIVEFENAALKRFAKRLERDVVLTPGEAFADDLAVLVGRFSRDCAGLLFFRELAFMPAEDVARLNTAVCTQVAGVFDDLARHLERAIGESPDSPVADTLCFVRRIRAQWREGGRIEQLC